jgi:plasmid stability protein
MANLTVKDLPDAVYSQLKEAARSEGRSLNGYIVSLLKADAEERSRRKLMRESRSDFRRFLGSLPRMDDSTPLIREDREHAH